MQLLCERIKRDGRVLPGDILKVDSFLNQQIDAVLITACAHELHRLFVGENVTKILTVEASGIALAFAAAQVFGVPMVFAKKSRSANRSPEVYSAEVASYTHGSVNRISVSKQYLSACDRVLIVDDFLALGNAMNGLISLCEQAGAHICGAGVAIEKKYQGGGDFLRGRGFRVEALASVLSMTDDALVLAED